jgi:hypothetical protein
MQLSYDKTATQPDGYVMKLSSNDTYRWAHKPGAAWPGSSLSSDRLVVCVDSNGLYDLVVNGRDASDDIDGTELEAIVADYLPGALRHLWPCWEE